MSDIIDVRIEGITATGSGLARAADRVFFADFTAPGDLVRLQIIEEKKTWARGDLLEVLEPSAARALPPCPLYGTCGGCNLQHLRYEAQLEAKAAILRESFERIGGFSPPCIRVCPSRPFEYRNRVQFHCIPANRKRAGFMEKKGQSVIPLDDCPVAVSGIRDALGGRGANRIMPPPEKDRFNVYSKDDVFLSEGGQRRGKITIGKSARKKELLVDAGVFFQSNADALENLLDDLMALAKKAGPGLFLADIFCGVGTFAAFLCEDFTGAELVEENKTALNLARENVKGSGCSFYALKADDWVKRGGPFARRSGFAVVDPPREGLTKPLRNFLTASGISVLAYVSCDPATLARDSADLTAGGFYLASLALYDFYPQTAHIESLAVFYREGVK